LERCKGSNLYLNRIPVLQKRYGDFEKILFLIKKNNSKQMFYEKEGVKMEK